MNNSFKPGYFVATVLLLLVGLTSPVMSQQLATSGTWMTPNNRIIIGIASFYDDPGETASGEIYDPNAFTAAVQIALRNEFGGIGFGKNYQPVYGIVEYGGKRALIKFNDVGTLRPGRAIDLSRAAMQHFGGIDQGLLPEVRVTILPQGRDYVAGPLPATDENAPAVAALAPPEVAVTTPASADVAMTAPSSAEIVVTEPAAPDVTVTASVSPDVATTASTERSAGDRVALPSFHSAASGFSLPALDLPQPTSIVLIASATMLVPAVLPASLPPFQFGR